MKFHISRRAVRFGDDPELDIVLVPIRGKKPEAFFQRKVVFLDVFGVKVAPVACGVHSIDSLMDHYGDHAAEVILELCNYKTFLRAGGPKTAEWAERHFGKIRRWEKSYSESWGQGGYSQSVQRHIQERSAILASTFLDIPLPELGGPFISVNDVPCERTCYVSKRSFDQVLGWQKDKAKIPAIEPRDNDIDQELEEWDPGDEAMFCGPKAPDKQEAAKRALPPPSEHPRLKRQPKS